MAFYDFTAKTRKGEDFDFTALKGKVVLVVNTATGCGFTPQYEGIEKLYETYHAQGFEVLDFPCNQFGHQAPGTDAEIHEFCTGKYKTQFDQLAKIDVNGEEAHPLYVWLKAQLQEDEIKGLKNKTAMKGVEAISKTAVNPGDIKWNFTKFLISREGAVVKRYSPTWIPADMEADIQALL